MRDLFFYSLNYIPIENMDEQQYLFHSNQPQPHDGADGAGVLYTLGVGYQPVAQSPHTHLSGLSHDHHHHHTTTIAPHLPSQEHYEGPRTHASQCTSGTNTSPRSHSHSRSTENTTFHPLAAQPLLSTAFEDYGTVGGPPASSTSSAAFSSSITASSPHATGLRPRKNPKEEYDKKRKAATISIREKLERQVLALPSDMVIRYGHINRFRSELNSSSRPPAIHLMLNAASEVLDAHQDLRDTLLKPFLDLLEDPKYNFDMDLSAIIRECVEAFKSRERETHTSDSHN